MIHFLPDAFDSATPYHEAVGRLASIRTALNLAERAAGLETSAVPTMPNAWPHVSAARQRCFDSRSVEVAQGAAAGLEMLAAQQAAGMEAHPKSVERLALKLRTELAGLDKLFSL
jgi:hypothetical protein